MPQLELKSGCVENCPYFTAVQGACDHDLRPIITRYLREHPDEICPIYESNRAEEMRALAKRLNEE